MADTDLTPFPRNAYSRRSVVAGIAGALPAPAIENRPSFSRVLPRVIGGPGGEGINRGWSIARDGCIILKFLC